MRILIEPGSYRCQNMGDVAMLQVALARLRTLVPGVELYVLTNAPEMLAVYCPEARPVPTAGRVHFLGGSRLGQRNQAGLRVRATFASVRTALRGGDGGAIWSFLKRLETADLVMIAGQGSMSDATAAHARNVLGTLDLAHRHGCATAMVGQGVGPLSDPELIARASAVLPNVGLIALREGRSGPPILASLGVPPERIHVTGDDAIELAYGLAPAQLGTAIGVNLRIAQNAEVDTGILEPLQRELRDLSSKLDAQLLPIPIARGQARDSDVLRTLLTDQGDGGTELDSPAKVITQVGRCRVVVTGAYHAAVFALAQGIPVVFLAQSEYYRRKYQGLVDRFSIGCELVPLDGQQLATRLRLAVLTAWERAPADRTLLRRAAEGQIELGWEAYSSVVQLSRPGRAESMEAAR